MPYCPYCGSEVSKDNIFCENCGAKLLRSDTERSQQFESEETSSVTPREEYRPRREYRPRYQDSGRPEYDDGICLLLCCCLSPIAALIYYLLTDHGDNYYYEEEPDYRR